MKKTYKGPERRKFLRLDYTTPLACKVCKKKTISNLFNGYIADVSQSGLRCKIKEKMKKRAEGRLKRGEVHYEVKIDPYTELELSRIQEAGYRYDRTNHVEITLKPLDGKLVQATWDWGVNLFRSGGWGKQEDIKYNLDTTPLRDKEHRPDLETLLKVQEDLKKHFDQRGRVIGERLDADYKLRFVLNYGTSIEGAVNEPTR